MLRNMEWKSGRWAAVLALALCQGCTSSEPPSGPAPVSAMNYVAYTAVSRIEYLRLLNSNETLALRQELENTLAHDVRALWSLIQQPVSADERQRAHGLLRLIAVQNERHPAPGWKADAPVNDILQAALTDNPAHADSLRARDWTKPIQPR